MDIEVKEKPVISRKCKTPKYNPQIEELKRCKTPRDSTQKNQPKMFKSRSSFSEIHKK